MTRVPREPLFGAVLVAIAFARPGAIGFSRSAV